MGLSTRIRIAAVACLAAARLAACAAASPASPGQNSRSASVVRTAVRGPTRRPAALAALASRRALARHPRGHELRPALRAAGLAGSGDGRGRRLWSMQI